MLLRIPEPYDFALSTVRFRDFGTDGATVLHEGGLHRVVAGREVRIERAPGGVRVDSTSPEAAEEVSRLLGLPFELDPFREWAAGDPTLGPIADMLSGFRPTLNPRAFEALVVAITTQQISLRAAAAIRGRFVQRYGVEHEVAWQFPARDVVARADPRDFPALGFSRRKAEYVVGLARSDLDLDALAALPDDEVIAVLTALPGLGRWTADWFLARHLARPHAWPAGDLGVRKAVSAFYADGRPLTIPEVRTMGERFAPFQNLSAQYLLVGARMAG
ncbi:MAG: DNA-3-methyladenine glycosylase 2 family protein [Actinobacteria bacterium]|nr:DNA-3-methyladenine glycosylase 2 family protein [Actinomycetota bacterium]